MNELIKYWKQEEARVFEGWDFSSIETYMTEEKLPWDYDTLARSLIKKNLKVLDMGTGGGEFLLSLHPFSKMTFATEKYKPNFEYAKNILDEEGICLKYVEEDSNLPFESYFFDVILNRHESFDPKEVYRILKPGGVFLTQQVGGMNTVEFATELLGVKPAVIDTSRGLESVVKSLGNKFEVLKQAEAFPKLRFSEVGAFVYFAKIIEWEFPEFSVEKHLDALMALQEKIEAKGFFELIEHRFLIKAIKK
ncbi:MAG: methyltransferase domain-containing protein [Clostridiales bacterium]|nr:methyltransferase domain-containing protein [Clostridiales bacterium]